MAKKRQQGEITEADAPTWDRFGGMLDVLAVAEEGEESLADEYLRLTAEENWIAERKKEIRDILGPVLEAVGENKVRGDGWLAHRYETHKPTKISEVKLLAAGVKMEVIEGAREGGDPYWVATIIKA